VSTNNITEFKSQISHVIFNMRMQYALNIPWRKTS